MTSGLSALTIRGKDLVQITELRKQAGKIILQVKKKLSGNTLIHDFRDGTSGSQLRERDLRTLSKYLEARQRTSIQDKQDASQERYF